MTEKTKADFIASLINSFAVWESAIRHATETAIEAQEKTREARFAKINAKNAFRIYELNSDALGEYLRKEKDG